jgi:hypothetical protein
MLLEIVKETEIIDSAHKINAASSGNNLSAR